MIPAFLATPAAKAAASLGLVAVLSLGYFGWREYQQLVGRQEARAQYYEQLLEQQQEATGHYIVREAMKLRTVERTMAEKDRVHASLRRSQQAIMDLEMKTMQRIDEEVRHAEAMEPPPCPVGSDVVRVVNDLSRVLTDITEERDASPGGATNEPPVSRP